MTIRAAVFIAFGILFFVVGIDMKNATKKWDEVVVTQIETPGTKTKNATIGATIGAVGGGALAAVIGGVGIVVAGTGVGLPAGATLIATAASIGAVTGGIGGAATGESSSINTVEKVITHIEPAYETWQWALVIFMAAVFLLIAIIDIRKKLSTATPQQ